MFIFFPLLDGAVAVLHPFVAAFQASGHDPVPPLSACGGRPRTARDEATGAHQ
jgi:hypothetical protein